MPSMWLRSVSSAKTWYVSGTGSGSFLLFFRSPSVAASEEEWSRWRVDALCLTDDATEGTWESDARLRLEEPVREGAREDEASGSVFKWEAD
jgi:hypothetical protein